MTQSLSRFQVIHGNPPHLPHKCAICGSINGTFIDFQLDLEFYGTVYFCLENCFTDLANELGYRSPAQHHVVLEAMALARAELVEAKDKIERLENALGALRYLDDSNSGIDGDAGSQSGTSRQVDVPSNQDELGPAGPASKSGLTDILNDDSLNELT